MIKDLMDGNPIRGRKGWREGRTGPRWRRFWVFLLSAAELQNWKVKSPNLVKIMSSSADVVLIQQITGLYIMSCRWRNQCRGEPGGTRFSPTGRICERCSFVPVSGSSWNLNVHVQIDGFYFTDLFFTLIPEYRKKMMRRENVTESCFIKTSSAAVFVSLSTVVL